MHSEVWAVFAPRALKSISTSANAVAPKVATLPLVFYRRGRQLLFCGPVPFIQLHLFSWCSCLRAFSIAAAMALLQPFDRKGILSEKNGERDTAGARDE